jgi:hypothetical protein
MSLFLKHRKKYRLLFASLSLAGGILWHLIGQNDYKYHQVIIILESSAPIETQLFYDLGKGFNENESIRKVVYQSDIPLTLQYDFSASNLYGLRFDPNRAPAKIKIHEIVIDYQDEKPFFVPLDSLKAVNDIKLLRYEGSILTVETSETTSDPILYLSVIGQAPRLSPFKIITWMLFGAAIALGIAVFIVWAYRNCLNEGEATL